ncbi:hypothetical protein FU323_03600 [Lactobacillus delbrueckii subsp. bulgaricus]|nr:hypothetical protein FU323_03600 [Lactobacillus delbrueckii subsp. bulgaricus]
MESDTIATFDLSASTTVPIWDVLNQMDDGLFRSDKNNNPVPSLAKKTVKSIAASATPSTSRPPNGPTAMT